jgi:tetratricopeptide (TPR) repeat protein
LTVEPGVGTIAAVRRRFLILAGLVAALAAASASLAAADQWIEVKSAHFTLLSNASEGRTRRLAWQLEQLRSAVTVLWGWMKPDLNKPLTILVLKDENSMREFAPEFWEKRGSVRPASVWVSGPDQHYLAIRADVEVDDQGTVNPYLSAYFSYGGLILAQSIDAEMPMWLERGLSGILSNTIVREDRILFGPIIPYNVRLLRERPRIPMAKLLTATERSPEIRQSEFLETFDAQSWALVHLLMFGDQGKRAPQLSAFFKLVLSGRDAATAFAEALGPPEAVEGALLVYIQRDLFAYQRVNADASVQREKFPVRALPPAEAVSSRALFHAAMGRPVEGRAAIAEARKIDPKASGSYTAEALILDREKKQDEAKAAYTTAVELGTASAYAHYRLASLKWQPRPTPEQLKELETLLSHAVDRNVRYAAAYAWLGQVRASLDTPDAIALIRRAITLEPRESTHRLRAASVLLRQGKYADARADAQAALALAASDENRREAQELLDVIAKASRH